MNRQQRAGELDVYLAEHKGLLTKAQENRYIDLVVEALAAPPAEGEEPAEDPLPLELLRLNKILQLRVYDSSVEVNSFSIAGQSMWITPEDRANYTLTIQAARAAGVERIIFEGVQLAVDDALSALAGIDLYAMQCVAVTEAHEAAIMELASEEDINRYDYTVGYPEKLIF